MFPGQVSIFGTCNLKDSLSRVGITKVFGKPFDLSRIALGRAW